MNNPATNVINMRAQPRIEKGKLGKHAWEVMFNQDTKMYVWVAHVTTQYDLHGENKTLKAAIASAETKIKKFTSDNDIPL